MTRKITKRISRQKRLQMQALERHSRLCIICHHPEREAIEEEFVHWRAPWKIADEYKVADSRTIYRHARATGILFERREGLHSALDAIVENAEDVTVTGDCILRAMRAYSCIDRRGRWTELPTHLNIATFQAARPIQHPAPVIDIEDAAEDTESQPLEKDSTCAVPPAQSSAVPKHSNRASRSDATACAASPAQSSGDYSNVASRRDATAAIDLEPKSSNRPSRSDATASAATPAQAFDELEEDAEDDDPDDDPEGGDEPNGDESETNEPNYSNPASLRDASARAVSPARACAVASNNQNGRSSTETACAVTPAQSSAAVEPKFSNRRSRGEPTSCATSPAQSSGDYSNVATRSDATTRAVSPARSSAVASKNQNNSIGRPSTATASAASSAQKAPAVRLTSKSRNRRTTATACAASPAQPAAAPKRSGAFSRSRPQPQPKKASRRKSTASDSFWRQTLDELTRKLAAAKAEAQRSATAVAPPAHAEAEGRVSESPSRDNDTACPSFPRDTKDLPGQASESESISQLITAPATQPATPPFTPTPAQAFPVQLRHPGPYGMSTGSAALSPQPEPPNIYTRARLIGSSAIRNFDKG